MEKPESLASVSGLSAESPRGVPRAVPGGVRGIQTDTGLPSGVALFRGSGPPLHSGGTVIHSPGPIQSSEGVVTLNSGLSPHLGEVAGCSLGSSKSPCTGTGAIRASTPGPGEPRVYSSESSPYSGSTLLHCQNYEERPRSILKNSSSILKKTSSGEKKSQRWDEMNILATYHPADKDYGFMKADEPSTPYHRLQDEEDLSAGSSLKVTPETLAERFATMDNFLPKVLQYGDNKSSRTADNFAKTYSSDFDKHRKIHYSEGKFLKTPKNQPLANEDDSSGASASISSSNQSVMMDLKSRPVDKGWAGRLATGVKNETVLVTDSNDSATYRNQFPSASDSTMREQNDLQRKEYYSKGRYLRSCSHPEIGEDREDEEQDSSSGLTWVTENPKDTADETSRLQLQWTQDKEPRPWKM
ncbi:2810408A11Rik [Phodopus roborovskii]|uniref:2810408A11Rik protein n=1 Tax=Phodopus roborovskii TaxID=109678 RepID=A0AAU9Z0K9_PHORO|nr:2810408A11Rik [Phodopus roborovskii]